MLILMSLLGMRFLANAIRRLVYQFQKALAQRCREYDEADLGDILRGANRAG
jgi:hypothetical protein